MKSFEEILREMDFKVTPQRLEIFNALVRAERHPSADEIYQRVKRRMPTITFDTVYRALSLFEKYGVIARLHCLDDRARYDSKLNPHHHLVCIECRDIQDFSWPSLHNMEKPEQATGWGTIKSKHIELRGICQFCLGPERKEGKQ